MTGEIALKVVGTTHEPAAMSVSDPSQPAQMNAQGYSLEVQAVSPTVTLTEVEGGTEMTVTDIHGSQTTLIPDGAQGPAGYTPVKGVDYFDGAKGEPGQDGQDGVSPVIEVSEIDGGHRVTVLDADGAHTVDVMDGAVGPRGIQGETGPAGETGNGIASVTLNPDYTLTIAMTDGTSYTTGSIRGETGETGAVGPQGPMGQTGSTGPAGSDGVSPAVSVTEITGGHRVAITDATGQHSFDVMDGEDGAAGAPGRDGVSPTASVTQTATGAIITTTDAHGTTSAEISNGLKGDPGDPTELIDDTAGDGETGKTWSADKLVDALADAGTVRDVQVNGVSVLQDGVADVPRMSAIGFGVAKIGSYQGVDINSNGELRIQTAEAHHIKSGVTGKAAIVPLKQHESTFYGLAKAAGADEKNSTLPVGQYTDAAKIAIRTMLGLDDQSIVDIVQAGLPAAEGVSW